MTLLTVEEIHPLLMAVDEQRKKGINCDVVLLPRNSSKGFKCHKCVLMARSEYFTTMFSSGLEEGPTVKMEGFSEGVLDIVVQYIYTGKVKIALDIAPLVLDAFSMMLMTNVVTKIDEWLASVVNEHVEQIFPVAAQYADLKKTNEKVIAAVTKPEFAKRSEVFKHANLDMICRIAKAAGNKSDMIFDDIFAWLVERRHEIEGLPLYENLEFTSLRPTKIRKLVDFELDRKTEKQAVLQTLLKKTAEALTRSSFHSSSFTFRQVVPTSVIFFHEIRSPLYSHAVGTHGLSWRVGCVKNEGHILAVLDCSPKNETKKLVGHVTFTHRLLSQNGGPTLSTEETTIAFPKSVSQTPLVSLQVMTDQSNGYMKDGRIIIETDLYVEARMIDR